MLMNQLESFGSQVLLSPENSAQLAPVNAGAITMEAIATTELQAVHPGEYGYPEMADQTSPAISPEDSSRWLGKAVAAVKERTGKTRRAVGVAVAGGAMLALAGCSNDSKSQADQTCFSQLNPDQESQLNAYIQNNGDAASVANNSNGTQDICVLEGNEAHYYDHNDKFNDYALYALMTNRGSDLATLGLINGDLSLDQALTLQMMTDVRSDGTVYRSYGLTSGTPVHGTWHEQQTVVTNVHITNIQYGHSAPTSYKTGSKKPPQGYVIKPFKSADPSQEGDVSGGKIVKKVAPANTYVNPARPDGTQPPTTSGNKASTQKSGSASSSSTQKPASTKACKTKRC